MSGSVVEWVSGMSGFPASLPCVHFESADFTRQCLTGSKSDGGATPKANLADEAYIQLLSTWANATLTQDSWTHALKTAVSVSNYTCSIIRGFDSPFLQSSQFRDSQYIRSYVNV